MSQDANKKILKNTIALYCRTAFTMAISFFTVRFTLQVLGVEDYGLYNLVGSISAMFSFMNLSMGTAVQRFFSYEIGKGESGQVDRVFGVGIYLHMIVAFVTLLAGELFVLFFFDSLNIPPRRLTAAMTVFQISLASMFCGIITVPYSALLRAREEFSKYALLDIIQALLRIGILLLLFTADFDRLILFSILNLIVSLLYILGVIFFAHKYKEARFRIRRDKKQIKEMFSFISLLIVTVLFSVARNNGLIMLINLFFGLAVNAAYAVAAQVMNMVTHFADNFKQSIVPQIMSCFSAGNMERMKTLLFSGTKITFILMMCITMPFIVEPYFVLDILLDEVPEYAAEFTRLVLININISTFTYFLYQGVHATGKIKYQQLAFSSIYLINLVGVYAAYKVGFGFYSAMYVTMICSFMQCVTNMYYAKKTYSLVVSAFIKQVVLPSLLLCAIIALPSFVIVNILKPGYTRAILVAISIVSTILIGSYCLYLNKQEKEYCKRIVLKILGRKNIV